MQGDNSNIEIKLVARADTGDLLKTDKDLQRVDQAVSKSEAQLKRLEAQARRTASAVGSIPRSSQPFAGLASPPSAGTFTDSAALRAAEAAAGRRTERSMAAEEREAADQALRRRRFFESTQTQRGADAAGRSSSALDGVSVSRTQIVGAVAGTAAAVGIAAKAFKELADQQSASQELAAAMYNRGIASDDFFQRLHRVAEVMRTDTGTKNADWLKVLADLVSSGANTQNIDGLAKGVEHLAALMNGNIPGAALAMEKAIQGNFETLSHWGVQIPVAATQAQKLEAALKQLAERGAGLMESRSKTLAGQWDNLKNSGYNLLAALAGTFTHSELLKQSMSGLGSIMQKAAEWFGLPVPKLEALNTRLVASSQALGDAQNAARKAAEEYSSLAQQADRAAAAMERQNRAEQSIRSAQENIASAQRDLRQAQIDAAVHSGAMSPQQGQIQSAALTLQFEQGRFSRNQQAQADVQHASEVRLNQLGTQHGLLSSEAQDVQRQLEQFQQSHAARAELSNSQLALEQAQNARAQLTSNSAAAAQAGGQVSVMIAPVTPEQIAAADRAVGEAQSRNQIAQFAASGNNITDQQGIALQERLARLTTALTELNQRIEHETPGLQDAAGNARLSQNANAAIFNLVQQTIRTQLNDHLSQTPVSGNIAQLRGALNAPDHEQENLIGQLREAIQLRSDLMLSGFTDLVRGINLDIANIQAQLRTLANRR